MLGREEKVTVDEGVSEDESGSKEESEFCSVSGTH